LPGSTPAVGLWLTDDSTAAYESEGWLRWLFESKWRLPYHSVTTPGLTEGALAPLFRAAGERAEACLAAMHAEAWGAQAAAGGSDACAQLQALLSAFCADFLARLPRAQGAPSRALAQQLAQRCLLLFVRHACLLRPLSEAGRLRLAQDCAEVELAVAGLCPLEQLGAPYKGLRALRPLLFAETAALGDVRSALLAELPRSCVLHHLLGRAPQAVLSPHARAGLTPAKYAAWLDRATEEDVWRGVRASLEAAAEAERGEEAVRALAGLGEAWFEHTGT
jgi:hypothetical protein